MEKGKRLCEISRKEIGKSLIRNKILKLFLSVTEINYKEAGNLISLLNNVLRSKREILGLTKKCAIGWT